MLLQAMGATVGVSTAAGAGRQGEQHQLGAPPGLVVGSLGVLALLLLAVFMARSDLAPVMSAAPARDASHKATGARMLCYWR